MLAHRRRKKPDRRTLKSLAPGGLSPVPPPPPPDPVHVTAYMVSQHVSAMFIVRFDTQILEVNGSGGFFVDGVPAGMYPVWDPFYLTFVSDEGDPLGRTCSIQASLVRIVFAGGKQLINQSGVIVPYHEMP